MALPCILLIDDNKVRKQQFEAILGFLELSVRTITLQDFQESSNCFDSIKAVFIGSSNEKQGAQVKAVKEKVTDIPIFLLVDKGTLLHVSSAIQKMVTKLLEWPTTYPVLTGLLENLPEPEPVIIGQGKSIADKGLAGNSPAIKQTRKLIDQVAGSEATVLILGESGTGKEVVAQALHHCSQRKNHPFVPVNCGAIPGELLESELFGHEKGAFTGALTARQGRFEMAEGGTLFLDEIGDMPMPMQVKLLRVLQERTFERVGSNKTIHCNVRIIAATHRHLEDEIKEKRFREDLFYRLNVFPIEVPSLRDRAEDIPCLVNDLIARMAAANRGNVKLTTDALAVLMQHDWPGNVRELANLIERLAIIKPNGLVSAADLPEKFQRYDVPKDIAPEILEQQDLVADEEDVAENAMRPIELASDPVVSAITHLPDDGMDLKEYLSTLESGLIKQALDECNGVVAHAAKLLNMRRTTLVEKLRKYELS